VKVTTSKDQAQNLFALSEMGALEVFKPVPPQLICDGIIQIDSETYLLGTNDRGTIVLHFLENTTKAEAWEFFQNMRGEKCNHINPRISFVGPSQNNAANN